MYKTKEELRKEHIVNMKGGVGDFSLEHFLEKEEFMGRGRMFAKATLSPGATVGMHTHKGDMEVCVFLEGSGIIKDNGETRMIKAGDVNICLDGQSHEVINNTDKDLVFIGLVLYS